MATKPDHAELDALIVEAIRQGRNAFATIYAAVEVRAAAERIAALAGQALRRRSRAPATSLCVAAAVHAPIFGRQHAQRIQTVPNRHPGIWNRLEPSETA